MSNALLMLQKTTLTSFSASTASKRHGMYVKVERLCCRLERSLTEMWSIFRSPEYS